jgi:DeoR/GlpR family transcriptional regulator of sugar metabolism
MKERNTKKRDLLANERRMKILEFVREDGSARVKTLGEMFNVTEPTIRQDLEKLEQEGYVIREHGGAYLRSMSHQVKTLSLQHTENLDIKHKIALKALSFIQDGDSIIIDSGSTMTEFSKLLVAINNLRVITNALNIALTLGTNQTCQLMVTGGDFKPPTLSLTGDKSAEFLKDVYVDKAFLAAGGISPTLDLTYPSFSDLPVKRAMIESSKETYVLADSSKFGRAAFASLGSLSQIDYLITDSAIPAQMKKAIEELGVKIIIA